jgi:hypothetical protein
MKDVIEKLSVRITLEEFSQSAIYSVLTVIYI